MDMPPPELLESASLLLDFDGTLVEIAPRPDEVKVTAELSDLLRRLHDQLDGRLALISGRPAQDVLQRLGLAGEQVHVVGSHGLEFAWAGRAGECAPRPAGLALVLHRLHAFAAEHPGVLVEDKPLGAALHFREAPAAQAASVALISELARTHGLYLQAGKMMIEARVGGGDKGSAIRRIMDEPEFAGTRPVFLGDDVTDEPGFRAAAELGGAGVLVGSCRESAACYRLPDVSAVRDWLAMAGEALV